MEPILHSSDHLIAKLSSSFNNVTNTYKHYWFWSIIELLQENPKSGYSFEEIGFKMLELVWYPLTFYKLSFGKQDSFVSIAQGINAKLSSEYLDVSSSIIDVINYEITKADINRIIARIMRYVPFRFLRPFYLNELRGIKDAKVNDSIISLANKSINEVPYKFENDNIIINELWKDSFITNYRIIKDFIHRNLIGFLSKANPNVIGISSKLERPQSRNLSSQRKLYEEYLSTNRSLECLYSKVSLSTIESLDHFIPWSYVVHDHLWNLIPVTRSANSSKSNNLPSFDIYLDPFIEFQYSIAKYVHQSEGKRNFKNSYAMMLNSDTLPHMDLFRKIYKDVFTPLKLNAANLGFSSNWKFNI